LDILSVIETFGVPVAMSIAFGFFIWKQNKFIQDELQKELRESFDRVEGIIIKLIDAQKQMQMKQADIKASYHAIVEILSSLSGNGLKEKFGRRQKEENNNW
tara:strand:- start:1513 stop:1818 length:306 start_codon:yes stop_codon:yes gene_type:complete